MSKAKQLLYPASMLMGITVLSFFIMAFSMRMIADDYCMAANAQALSIWEFLQSYYLNWSGQFTYPFIKSFTHTLFGLQAPIIMPLLTYALLWAGMVVLLSIIFRQWSWQRPNRLALISGTLHLFILLSTMASRQTMYWLDALLFHVLPLAIFVWIIIGWVLALQSAASQRIKVSVGFALLFIYGGTHLLTSLFGLAFWLLAIGVLWFALPDERRNTMPITVAAFLGNLLAFLIVLIAPGNWQRLAVYEGVNINVSLLDGSVIALEAAVRYWFSPFSLAHFVLVIAVMIAICIIWHDRKYMPLHNPIVRTICQHTGLIVAVSILIGLLYSAASLLLPAISMGTTSTRVFVTAGLAKTSVSIWVGFLLGIRFVHADRLRSLAPVVVMCGMGLLMLGSAYRFYGNLEIQDDYVAWSQEWDARHSALANATTQAARVIEVVPFSRGLPKLLGPDPDALVAFTSCVQDFYGIPTLVLNPELETDVIRIVTP